MKTYGDEINFDFLVILQVDICVEYSCCYTGDIFNVPDCIASTVENQLVCLDYLLVKRSRMVVSLN